MSDLFPLLPMFTKLYAEKILLTPHEILSTTSVKLSFIRLTPNYDRSKYPILEVTLQEFVYQTRYSRKLFTLLSQFRKFLEINYYRILYIVEVKEETILYKGQFFRNVPGKYFRSIHGR